MTGDASTGEWPSAEDIFSAAMALEAGERSGYVKSACGNNAALRQRVERLLRAHETAERFLPETPATNSPGGINASLTVGDYELLEEIARGGMGIVYRARQRKLDRIVAVKMILSGQFASKDQMLRFRVEAETAARLQHPNIVRIHETGEHDGQPYFSMDFVEGKNLTAWVREKPLPARRAAGYVKTIAEAIHYAHEQGVLHRDLKPSNVLIDQSDQVRVTDFGLAKRVARDSFPTVTGQIMGSPGFMPPEQASPGSSHAGRASDVYGLGGILFFLVTGRAPFVGETIAEILQRVMQGEPVSPRVLNPSVPLDLATVCLKCLEKNPAKRYPTAQELADELQRFLHDEPISAHPVGPIEKLWRWCRRKPVVAALGAGMLLLLMALVVGSVFAAVRFKRADDRTTAKLWESHLAQARANRLSGRPGQRYESLEVLAKAAAVRPSIELRNEVIACLALDDLRPSGTFFDGGLRPENALFDSSLQRYAIAISPDEISVRSAANGEEIARLRQDGVDVAWLRRFSRNGHYLYFESSRAGQCVWDIPARALVFSNRSRRTGDFTPDNQRFVLGHSDGSLSIYELDSGTETARVGSGETYHVSVAPNGAKAACVSRAGRIVEIRELTSGKVLQTLSSTGISGSTIAWSEDSHYLATPCHDGRAYVWNAESGALQATMHGHDGRVVRAAFNRAGTLLATTSWDDTVRLWDAFTGKPIVVHPGTSFQLGFSPNDSRLAFVMRGRSLGLLDVALHPAYSRLTSTREQTAAHSLAVHPNGRLLAAQHAGSVRLWDLPHRRELAELAESDTSSVLFHPDGHGLITVGNHGVHFWPLRSNAQSSGITIQIGPRRRLWPGVAYYYGALSADGRRLAVAGWKQGGALLFDLDKPGSAVKLRDHPNSEYISISPDGRWVATGTVIDSGVAVWDTQSFEKVWELRDERSAFVQFSPDGLWLAISGREDRLWSTASWRPGPKLADQGTWAASARKAAFSPDSALVAIVSEDRKIRLHQVATGRLLALLEPPNPVLLSWLMFSGDGTRLLALESSTGEIQVWDLRVLRRELAALNLDWDLPPYPAASASSAASVPLLSVQVMTDGDESLDIPPRDPKTTRNQIDLSPHYNAQLTATWYAGVNENSLSNVPQGTQKFGDVIFDVRGIVQLAGARADGRRFPERISGIQVGMVSQRLHFLHATQGRVKDGNEVGSLKVHFADSSQLQVPLRYGAALRDWWTQSEIDEYTPELRVAWRGSNADSQKSSAKIRLMQWTWTNPLPDLEITSIDYVSALADCAPFLVAITAE